MITYASCIVVHLADMHQLLIGSHAAFAEPEVYEYLVEWHFLSARGLRSHEVLDKEIQQPLKRPVWEPPKRPIVSYDDFQFEAEGSDRVCGNESGEALGKFVFSVGLRRH